MAGRRLVVRHHGQTLNDVRQLANVAGMVICVEHRPAVLADPEGALARMAAAGGEVIDQMVDQGSLFAQGRNLKRDHAQPVEQIAPEVTGLDHAGQVPVGRRDDAGVDML